MAALSREQRIAALRAGSIDVHTHAIDPRLGERLAEYPGSFPVVRQTTPGRADVFIDGRLYREVDDRCWSASVRLADMDAEAVAVQVVSAMPVTLCHDQPPEGASLLASLQNEFLADLVSAAPDRFLAFGCVPLQDPEAAIKELRRCVSELGFVGVQIGTRVGDRELADPDFVPFLAEAAALDAVVFIHPVDRTLDRRLVSLGLGFGVGMPSETGLAAAALLVGGLFDEVPGLRVLLAHGGGTLPGLLPRVSVGQRVVGGVDEPTSSATLRAQRLWCDSLTYDADSLLLATQRFGVDHVVLGTDYPFAAREVPAGAVLADAAGISGIGGVARANALALLAPASSSD
jgi:aminocarboxymuconate-semialdehyde decarboxylase